MTVRSAAIALVLLGAPAAVQAKVWTVGGRGADFPLIAPAVAASGPHDVIQVRRGVYREDLTLNHPVSIVGEDGVVLFGTGTGTVIEITAPGCEIRGLTIDGTGNGASNDMDAAIRITSSGNRIVGNRIRRAFYGIVVAGAAGNLIEGNDIAGLADEPFGRRGDGIYLYRAPNNQIRRNTVSGMRDAIYFQYAPGGIAVGNVVRGSRYGLHDMFSDNTRIAGNVFSGCSAGASLMNSSELVFEGNEVSENRGVTGVGLSLKDCDRSEIRGNRFAANGKGLQLDGSTGNRFTKNRFIQNDTAVRLMPSAECNVFAKNEFAGNWSDVVAGGGGGSTQWSADGVGNRWSAYAGFDFDGDGLGDTPHSLSGPFERIEGANALARLFLQSPAASALALVARMSPPGDGLEDSHPLSAPVSSHRHAPLSFGLFAVAMAAWSARSFWR